jgi:hypothetical protein
MRTAPGRPGTAQLTSTSSRAKHARETLPVGHNAPQEAPQALGIDGLQVVPVKLPQQAST